VTTTSCAGRWRSARRSSHGARRRRPTSRFRCAPVPTGSASTAGAAEPAEAAARAAGARAAQARDRDRDRVRHSVAMSQAGGDRRPMVQRVGAMCSAHDRHRTTQGMETAFSTGSRHRATPRRAPTSAAWRRYRTRSRAGSTRWPSRLQMPYRLRFPLSRKQCSRPRIVRPRRPPCQWPALRSGRRCGRAAYPREGQGLGRAQSPGAATRHAADRSRSVRRPGDGSAAAARR